MTRLGGCVLESATCHSMVNQSLLFSAGLNTKHPRGMHSSYWFHLEPGGRNKRKGTPGPCYVCLQSLTESHMDLRGIQGWWESSLYLTSCQSRLPGFQTGVKEQAYSKTAAHCIHAWRYPGGARLARAGNDTQLEDSCIGEYWKLSFHVTRTHSRNGSLI